MIYVYIYIHIYKNLTIMSLKGGVGIDHNYKLRKQGGKHALASIGQSI